MIWAPKLPGQDGLSAVFDIMFYRILKMPDFEAKWKNWLVTLPNLMVAIFRQNLATEIQILVSINQLRIGGFPFPCLISKGVYMPMPVEYSVTVRICFGTIPSSKSVKQP